MEKNRENLYSSVITVSSKLFKYAFFLFFSGRTLFFSAIAVKTMDFKMKISTKSHLNFI